MFTRSHTRPFRSSIRVCSFQLVATNKSRQNFNLPPFDRSQFPKNHRRPRTQLLLCRWCDLLKLFKVSLIKWQFEQFRDIFVRDLESLIQEKEKKPVFCTKERAVIRGRRRPKTFSWKEKKNRPEKGSTAEEELRASLCVCASLLLTRTQLYKSERRERDSPGQERERTLFLGWRKNFDGFFCSAAASLQRARSFFGKISGGLRAAVCVCVCTKFCWSSRRRRHRAATFFFLFLCD